MTDLEITRLCAKAMGFKEYKPKRWWTEEDRKQFHIIGDFAGLPIVFDPLHDISKARILVKTLIMLSDVLKKTDPQDVASSAIHKTSEDISAPAESAPDLPLSVRHANELRLAESATNNAAPQVLPARRHPRYGPALELPAVAAPSARCVSVTHSHRRVVAFLPMYAVYYFGCGCSWVLNKVPDWEGKYVDWFCTLLYRTYSWCINASWELNDWAGFRLWYKEGERHDSA